MSKSFAFVTFVVFVVLGTIFAFAFEASASPAPSSVGMIVAPDPMPVDTSRAAIPAVEPTPIQTSAEITIYANAPRKVKPAARIVKAAPKPEKVWTCGAPMALENDAVQTVRQCDFR